MIESFQSKFTNIAEQFTNWSQQSTRKLQYLVWTILENEGFGASLQLYYPKLSVIQNNNGEYKIVGNLLLKLHLIRQLHC